MIRCPFCGLPAYPADGGPWPGWSSCPRPCSRLWRGPERVWVLFQLPFRGGRPRGDKAVHRPHWRGAGPGTLWIAPDDGLAHPTPEDLTRGSRIVPRSAMRSAVRGLVSGAPAAEVQEVMDL